MGKILVSLGTWEVCLFYLLGDKLSWQQEPCRWKAFIHHLFMHDTNNACWLRSTWVPTQSCFLCSGKVTQQRICKQLMHETSVTSKVTQYWGYKITVPHSRFWINTRNVFCVWNLTKGQVCLGNRCSNTSLIPGLFLKYSEYSACGPWKADSVCQ